MENNLLIRAFLKEFTGECREKFPTDAPVNKQLAFLKDHTFSYLNSLEEIMFAAWADDIDTYEFLLSARIAYEEYQARQGSETEEQDKPF